MRLTKKILEKLGFENKGKIWTKWVLDLHEDEPNVFSVDVGRIYFDVETVEELHDFWKVIKAEEDMPLLIDSLQKLSTEEIKQKAQSFIKEFGLDELETKAFVEGALWMQSQTRLQFKKAILIYNR